MFSGDLNTNVDLSDFILVKYPIANLTSENKNKMSLNHKKIKASLTENHAKINKWSLNISASSGAKMIKIRLEMTSQYFFLKNVVLYEIYGVKSRVANNYVPWLD